MQPEEERGCFAFDEADLRLIQASEFWLQGVLVASLSCLGIGTNVVASAVLLGKEMRRHSFNLLLVALSCFDALFLATSLVDTLRTVFQLAGDYHVVLFPVLFYPLQNIALRGSIYMTAAISVERHSTVKRYLLQSNAGGAASRLWWRVGKYVAAVVVLAVVTSITKFFEARVVYTPSEEHGEYNVALQVTELRLHPLYVQYLFWSSLILTGVVPMAIMLVFSVKTWSAVNRWRRLEESRGDNLEDDGVEMEEGTEPGMKFVNVDLDGEGHVEVVVKETCEARTATKENKRAEANLAHVFIAVVALFVVCHSPRHVLNIHEAANINKMNRCYQAGLRPFPAWVLVGAHFSHVLLAAYSGLNVVVYCCLSRKFRSELKRMLRIG